MFSRLRTTREQHKPEARASEMKKRIALAILACSWIPLGMIGLAWIRGFTPEVNARIALNLVMMAPAGIPLAIPVYRLWSWRWRKLTIILCVPLVPLSVAAVLVGGLLGPPGILIYAAICSLPAWFALGVVFILRHRSESETDATR